MTAPVRNRNEGFSAIELLVVIVLAALLLAWGWPRLATLANKYRLDSAAWTLATDLQKVRLRAIAEGTEFRVSFDTGAKTYQVQKSVGGSWQNDGGARPIEDLGSLSVTLNPAGRTPTFTSRGVLDPNTTTKVVLAAPTGGQRQIFIESAGGIHVN
jgi:prepilin-type N-terminal cleavage/methylation domain-containing protein